MLINWGGETRPKTARIGGILQIKIRVFDDANTALKISFPGSPDTNLITVKAIGVKEFNPELKGGFALIGTWYKPVVSKDQLIACVDCPPVPLVVYTEFATRRFVLVVVPEAGYVANFGIPGGSEFYNYGLQIDQVDCRVVTFFSGYSLNDAEVSRWKSLCNLSMSDLKSRCSNSLYRAGFWMFENNHVQKGALPAGMTSEQFIAQKLGDKQTLNAIAMKMAGNVPVDHTEQQLDGYQTFNTQNVPDVRPWGFEWIGVIGGVLFVSKPRKTMSQGRSMLFADVLAKEIAKNKMQNPEAWQKFFEEQASQLEGIAMTYRVIADIARTNREFEKLKEK